METVAAELTAAVRGLARARGATAVVALTLALGIGMTTAVFSVVNGVLLSPLPYPDADRLVYVDARWTEVEEVVHASHSGGDFREYQRDARSFSSLGAFTSVRQNLTGSQAALQVQVGWVSESFFPTLGVSPSLGRHFSADDQPGTVILGHALWTRAFGADPSVVGRRVELDGFPVTVVGVLPEGFRVILPPYAVPDAEPEIWRSPDANWANGDLWTPADLDFALLKVVARLAPGVTVEEARREMRGFQERLRERWPDHEEVGFELDVLPLAGEISAGVRPTLLVLLGAVGFVLLIACANVAGLLLVRGRERRGDIALRVALGAGRGRVLGTLLAESLVLAVTGGALGLGLGVAATRVLAGMAPPELSYVSRVGVDGTVLLFAAAVSLGCTLLFGLLPALSASRVELAAAIRSGRDAGAPGGARAHGALVVAEVSLALVLLAGAGLLLSSFVRLHGEDPGFDPEGVLTFHVSLPSTKYSFPDGTDRFFRELEDRIEGLPGVRSAGVAWPMPLSGRGWSGETGTGPDAGEAPLARYTLATPGFFGTLGLQLLEGRGFSDGDPRGVAIVDRTFAERRWPGQSAVGRTLRAEPWGGVSDFEVIGVVDAVRYGGPRRPAEPRVYFDSKGWSWADWEVDVLVRTAGPPMALVEPIRDQLAAMDADAPMARPRVLTTYLDDLVAPTRFALWLVGLFAAVAVALTAVGLYGVLSWGVTRRRKEIGIRMALGSRASSVLALVLRQGAAMTLAGAALGLAGALALTRFLDSLLYGVEAADPSTLAAVTALLVVVGLAACWLPARRAAAVHPAEVLRSE